MQVLWLFAIFRYFVFAKLRGFINNIEEVTGNRQQAPPKDVFQQPDLMLDLGQRAFDTGSESLITGWFPFWMTRSIRQEVQL